MDNSDDKSKWWKHIDNNFIDTVSKREFEKEYLGEIHSPTFLENIEKYSEALLRIKEPKQKNDEHDYDFMKRCGVYQNQIDIGFFLSQSVKLEKMKIDLIKEKE